MNRRRLAYGIIICVRCHRAETEQPILAVADTEGHVTLHEYFNDDDGVRIAMIAFPIYVGNEPLLQRRLKQVQSIECASSDVLCLSLDWSNRRKGTSYVFSLHS